MTERPPYDEDDAGRVRRYLESRGRRLVDPLGADRHPNDPFFAPSLACARHQMLDAFGAKRPDGTRFRVYPAFVESHRPNAFAVDLGEGLHLCGINTGMVTSLFELAAFTFSQANLFAEVGNPAVEDSPRLPPTSLLGYWIADCVISAQPKQATATGESFIPRDPERRLMAHFLTQIMLRFVWFHELFHGVNGHSGYIAEARLNHEMSDTISFEESTIIEVENSDCHSESWQKMRFMLELDADITALRAMIDIQLEGKEPFELFAEQEPILRIKLNYFSVFMMTFLFWQSAKRQARSGTTHPNAAYRMWNFLYTEANRKIENKSLIRSSMKKSMSELEKLKYRVPLMADFLQTYGPGKISVRNYLTKSEHESEITARFAYIQR